MRIGLSHQGSSVNEMVEHTQWAEEEGFNTIWWLPPFIGDPLVPMALAARATSSIELGTAVLNTYTCHPMLQAHRVASVVAAMDRPGFTLGIGPSHAEFVRGIYGLSYDHPGRNTEEYTRIITSLLRGEQTDFEGEDWTVHSPRRIALEHPVPVLLAAFGPRLLRVAGAIADGVLCNLASAAVLESRVVPQLTAAATAAGRPAARIVARATVAVHDDIDEARTAAAEEASSYSWLPNYKRVLTEGGFGSGGDAAIVGPELTVARQLQALVDAGATDVWAAVFPVGDDPGKSLRRTTDLLAELLG